MTRVLHVFGQLNRGGAELRTLDIFRRLERGQPEMEFVVLSGLPGELDDEIRMRGGRIHYCRLGMGFPWRFANLLRERRVDVVHSHVYHFSGYILRCSGLIGVPTRIAHLRSVTSTHPSSMRRWLQDRMFLSWMNRWATLILGNSEASLAYGWSPSWAEDARCAVIHNGLDITGFKADHSRHSVHAEFGWPESCPIAIHIGRMDLSKNHERLLEVWAEMSAENPAWRFLSAGRINPERFSTLEKKAERLGISSNTVWAGQRTDIPRLLSASNTMVFPSLWEGLPGAVLEANAAGVPVVGSDIPSIREITNHLANVKCVSLSDDNQRWVAATMHPDLSPQSREICATAFERSVYGIERCVNAHILAWSGGTAGAISDVYRQQQVVPSLRGAA